MNLTASLFSGMILLFLNGHGSENTDMHSDSGETLAKIIVHSGEYERFDTPLSFSLDAITHVYEKNLRLYELTENIVVPVDVQFTGGNPREMHWLLSGHTDRDTIRIYELRKEHTQSGSKRMKIERNPDNYVLYSGDKQVIQYNSGTMPAPQGANPVYRRSGFFHPLFSPNSAVLTNIQPPGHLHHYGIMNPWTRTTFRGEVVDFWNLAKEEGRVRFNGLASANEGNVFASLQVHHEHIAWPDTPKETIAMNELQEVKVFHQNDGSFLIEINSRLNPTEKLILEEYLYGGFLLRATDFWTHENSRFFTSEGLNREEANEERARWCVVSGDTPQGKAGILIMSHPSNYNHPEPVRVWNSDDTRPRDYFINFSPTMNMQWELEAGIDYTLRYRMLVFDGSIDKERAALIWNDFANPPQIIIDK